MSDSYNTYLHYATLHTQSKFVSWSHQSLKSYLMGALKYKVIKNFSVYLLVFSCTDMLYIKEYHANMRQQSNLFPLTASSIRVNAPVLHSIWVQLCSLKLHDIVVHYHTAVSNKIAKINPCPAKYIILTHLLVTVKDQITWCKFCYKFTNWMTNSKQCKSWFKCHVVWIYNGCKAGQILDLQDKNRENLFYFMWRQLSSYQHVHLSS